LGVLPNTCSARIGRTVEFVIVAQTRCHCGESTKTGTLTVTNKVYGVGGVDYFMIRDQLGVPMFSVRHAVSRGLLDIFSEPSIALFAVYKSKGDFRDAITRTLIAWDDWKAGRPFSEPSIVLSPNGKPLNSIQQATIGLIWNNESPTLANKFKQALAGNTSALALSGEMARKQEDFRRKKRLPD
jgi:hypothetical protein